MNEARLTQSCWLAFNMEDISRRDMEGRVQKDKTVQKNTTYPLHEFLIGVTHCCLVCITLQW